jgi:hypothetical protein
MATKFNFYCSDSWSNSPKGRGSWAFRLTDIDGLSGFGKIHFTPSMTLTEAKRFIKPIIMKEIAEIIENVSPKEIWIDILP